MFLQSVIVYSTLICIMILCGYFAAVKEHNYLITNEGKRKLSFLRFEIIFPLLLFSVIFGMRFDVGMDYLGYFRMYQFYSIPDKIEPLFKYLIISCKDLGLHFTIFFGIVAFIQVFFFFYAFKDERFLFPFLVFALFVNGDWMFWMNGMRQAISMCIWIYSIKYIVEKKIIYYILWGIVAFLFHRSALLLFIFYPILKNGKDYFKKIPLQLFLIGLMFFIRGIFNSISSKLTSIVNLYISILGKKTYGSSYNIDQLTEGFVVKSDGTGIAFIFRIIINIIIILYSKKLKEFYNSKRFNVIYFFYFFGLLTLYVFPSQLVAINRPFRFFYVFQCIMLAYFLNYLFSLKVNDKVKILYRIIIVLFILVFYLGLYVSNKDSHLWFQFYFQAL